MSEEIFKTFLVWDASNVPRDDTTIHCCITPGEKYENAIPVDERQDASIISYLKRNRTKGIKGSVRRHPENENKFYVLIPESEDNPAAREELRAYERWREDMRKG